ncbi:hypothetical protein BpHYR1_037890 [Brachionus plicatilis]|uniref:Uncharacterized protein n=1 Tax=Brachionus plicatilis TaxID=10195 RepID=A0A3M7QNH2_BRAPC|nr:hypothetical protein BpHYR1_037890 [Brachionus plicatilis]
MGVNLSDDSNDDFSIGSISGQNLSNLRNMIAFARSPLVQQRQQVVRSDSGYRSVPIPIPVTARPDYTTRPIPIPVTSPGQYTTRPIPIPISVTTTNAYTTARPTPIPVTPAPSYQRSRQILVPGAGGSVRRIFVPRMRFVAAMPGAQGQRISQIRRVAMIPNFQY